MLPLRLTGLTLLLATLFLAPVSHAAERIAFVSHTDFKNLTVKKFLKDYTFSEIAAVDLNEDGIDEFILKQDELFQIIALTDTKGIDLGVIAGRKLMLSYDFAHGVRSILVFQDSDNDYAYRIYQWDPKNSQYHDLKRIQEQNKT